MWVWGRGLPVVRSCSCRCGRDSTDRETDRQTDRGGRCRTRGGSLLPRHLALFCYLISALGTQGSLPSFGLFSCSACLKSLRHESWGNDKLPTNYYYGTFTGRSELVLL